MSRARVAHETPHHLDVVLAKGGSTRRHRSGDAREVARHDVRVPLHHHHLAFLANGRLCHVQPVQHVRLLVERGLGRVQILGPLVVFVQTAGTKADHFSRDVPNRPQEPSPEPVVHAARTLRDQSRRFELRFREPFATQVVHETGPSLRRIADPKQFGCVLTEVPFQEKVPSHLGFWGSQLGLVELGGHAVGIK